MIPQCPIPDETALRGGQPSSDQLACRDIDLRFAPAIDRMEMRRRVIIEEHPDRDAVEP